jgi:hypothetical protein
MEKRFDDNIVREYKLTFIEKNGKLKFYSYGILKNEHGLDFAELMKLLILIQINF